MQFLDSSARGSKDSMLLASLFQTHVPLPLPLLQPYASDVPFIDKVTMSLALPLPHFHLPTQLKHQEQVLA